MKDARELLTRLPLCFKPETAGNLSMTAQYMTAHPVYITIDRGHCSAHEGLADNPDVTLRIRDDHLIKLMTGRMHGLPAFLTGKIKVEGNYRLAQKLQQVFDTSRLS
ncbi:SCP2 sterol-binding domain-containing protein [Salinisphaera sp. SPP-AMP-43]|uniref:SCP2 sterol-binding domain-containing protein n=1 Tax=Salinisphaera sp. SPP-AMP-43 TaxID=3121288 RepID=UPI003C6E7002